MNIYTCCITNTIITCYIHYSLKDCLKYFYEKSLCAALCTFCFAASMMQTHAQSSNTDSTNISDSIAINNLIERFYKTLSFTAVADNRYDTLVKFFIPEGYLISNAGTQTLVWKVQQYIEGVRQNFTSQELSVWDEVEVCATTEIFGKIAHRFSTFNVRVLSRGEESFRAGINSFQLVKQPDGWKITTVCWDRETATLKIPSKYLCQ